MRKTSTLLFLFALLMFGLIFSNCTMGIDGAKGEDGTNGATGADGADGTGLNVFSAWLDKSSGTYNISDLGAGANLTVTASVPSNHTAFYTNDGSSPTESFYRNI